MATCSCQRCISGKMLCNDTQQVFNLLTCVFCVCVCVAMLQEIIDAAKDAAAAEEKNEMEELKLLLPEIREKVEDAKESQRTASAASQAIQQTLVRAHKSLCVMSRKGRN